MNIRIKNLSMVNFKCFRAKEFTFDADITTIRGRNGEGKTTIADAILFCLFGKNVQGQSDLELFKTREGGVVIPNLPHSVGLTLSADGKEVTLERSIKEVWVKKRGSEESVFKNNTCEYYVNGETYTKSDYEKYINSLVSENVFKAITNPNYFPSLKWQDQRQFLTSMVGEVKPDEVADTEELKELVSYFSTNNDTLESYLKHLSYRIKEIKKLLEKIPVRLEEQNKALPEKMDWSVIADSLESKTMELKEVEKSILTIKQGNGSDIKRSELRNRISEISSDIDKLRYQAQAESASAKSDLQKLISESSIKFSEAVSNQRLMEQTIEADNRLIQRCDETSKDCEDSLARLRAEWPSKKFELSENVNICPTCGQSLPADVVEGKIATLEKQFNLNREAKIKELHDRADKVKKQQAEAADEKKRLMEKIEDDKRQLENIKEEINAIFSNKARLEKTHISTADEILAGNKRYAELSKHLEDAKSELDNLTDDADNSERLTELEASKAQYEAEISNLTQQSATKVQYDKIMGLIEGINEEERTLVAQLSDLEKREDIAKQYQFRQNQLIEERINKHFSLVQWKLFRTVNNSGDPVEEPYCECYVNGIAYHGGLNQAARLNAGLDICRALCQFYNVTAPIIVDNCESVNNLLETESQQIRLYVSEDDHLIVS